ncbi:MAG: hypothetical protein LBT29_06710 [Flavobacteriaceae bacterium]|jgi:hypothetical protein|nr:hypothetical protein [Flavobacteriaceae bacterium]
MKMRKMVLLLILMSVISCGKKNVILNEKFDNNANHWDISNNNDLIYSKIENGEWRMSGQVDKILNISLIPVQFSGSMRISAVLKTEKFYSQTGMNGLILFADNQKYPKNYLFFGVNAKNEVIISLENLNADFAQTYYMAANKNYKSGQKNNFALFVQENRNIQFLLNSVPIINIKKPENIGNFCGFVTVNSEITADDFLITTH